MLQNWFQNKRRELLVLVAVVAVLAALVAIMDRDASSVPDKYDVQATCKQLVREGLKNPTTADFSDEEQGATEASGTVVSENALGGKVTATYRCSVDGDQVRLEGVTPR